MAIEPITLRTERLVLRPWRFEDVEEVVDYCGDPEVARFLPLPQPYTPRDGVMFVARQVLTSWEDRPCFAIEIDGRCSGDINLTLDRHDNTAALGYLVARRHWAQGYMTEAAWALISWAFDMVGVEKVWATADAENVGSWRVMEKCGMEREAYLRSHRVLHGERRDVVQYGLLRADWEASLSRGT